jgi:uncharacterized protein YqjF (DUF2071 family)
MLAERAPAFLTAEWRYIALLNYEVPAALLEPYVPAGTELDRHGGRAFLSLVGFRFLHTRVLGCRVPFHQHFEEVNLRFYVRRTVAGEVRRGVTFIREIVPRRAIAVVARAVYNEPYLAMPMRSEVPNDTGGEPVRVRYAWQSAAGWNHLMLTGSGVPTVPPADSEAAFIAEHYWGYTRQRDGRTVEYRVAHPAWRVWPGAAAGIGGNMGAFYGTAFGEVLSAAPASAFLADGSAVTVFRPAMLPYAGSSSPHPVPPN